MFWTPWQVWDDESYALSKFQRSMNVGEPQNVQKRNYCEYLGSSGGYGSSGGVPEVRESGIWKFGAGYGSSGVFFFLIISKNLPLKGKFFEMVSRALPPRGVWGAWPPRNLR